MGRKAKATSGCLINVVRVRPRCPRYLGRPVGLYARQVELVVFSQGEAILEIYLIFNSKLLQIFRKLIIEC